MSEESNVDEISSTVESGTSRLMGPAIQDSLNVLRPMLQGVFGQELSANVIAQLKTKITILEEEVNKLYIENKKLHEEVNKVKIDSKNLQEEVNKVKIDSKNLQEQFKNVMKSPGQSYSLIAREAMCSLENYVVLDIIGSKSQMKKLLIYDFDDLKLNNKDGLIKSILPIRFQDLIRYYKKQGNSIHDISFSKSDLHDALMFGYEDDPNDSEEEKIVLRAEQKAEADYLCAILEKYSISYLKPFGVSPINK